MANSKQATKRARNSEKTRQQNMSKRSRMRTYIKKTVYAVEAGELEVAKENYKILCPILDRYADKGLIHKNKAARHKRNLNIKIKALALAS